MTWRDFYFSFDDWADSTRVNRISQIEDFGDSNEVTEITIEYSYIGEKEATRFIKRALSMGVRFSAENIMEILPNVEEGIALPLVKTHTTPFTKKDIEELYWYLDEKEIKRLSKESNISIPQDEEEVSAPTKKVGFFSALFTFLEAHHHSSSHSHRRCNGDCSSCPPHYGYRYGRWYYGHDHIEGCEFGGNKGGGGI